jgi:hypothetical protein
MCTCKIHMYIFIHNISSYPKYPFIHICLYIIREGVSFVEGNCFNIDVAASTACCRYDRIYIGRFVFIVLYLLSLVFSFYLLSDYYQF